MTDQYDQELTAAAQAISRREGCSYKDALIRAGRGELLSPVPAADIPDKIFDMAVQARMKNEGLSYRAAFDAVNRQTALERSQVKPRPSIPPGWIDIRDVIKN